MNITHSRFGIFDASPLAILGHGQLEVTDLGEEEKFLVTLGCKGLRDFFILMKGRVAFERTGYAIRLTTPFLDLLFYSKKDRQSSMTIKALNLQDRYPLTDLYSFAVGESLAVRASQGEDIRVRISHESGFSVGGNLSFRPELDCELHGAICRILFGAWIAAKHFDLQSVVNLSLADAFCQAEALCRLGTILSPGSTRVGLGGDFEPSLESKDITKSVCLPLAYGATLGEYRILVGVVALGELVRTSTGHPKFEMVTDNVRIVDGRIFKGDETAISPSELVRSISSRFQEEYECLILAEFRE